MLQPMLFNVYSLPKGYSIIQSHANLISTLKKREKKKNLEKPKDEDEAQRG